MQTLETERMVLHWPEPEHAPFMLRLLNDPGFLEHIGDRGVRTVAQARDYLQERMRSSFEKLGLGMFVVESREGGLAGVCGLVQREELEDVDLGFAFLPEFRARGLASESSRAVMEHARRDLDLERLVAIVSPSNVASIGLLGKLGFRFEQLIRMSQGGEELELHGVAL